MSDLSWRVVAVICFSEFRVVLEVEGEEEGWRGLIQVLLGRLSG